MADKTAYEGREQTLVKHVILRQYLSAWAHKVGSFCDIVDAEIETIHGEFEDQVPSVIAFIKAGGGRNFPFIFIDPTGWSGFAMDTIEPLLQLNPIEVLINFMTSHIRRFIESPQEETRDSFVKMFGSADYQDRVQGKTLMDKEDSLIGEYFRNLRTRGKFEHVAAAMVLDPEISRTAFHLIYATRNRVGLEVFKGAEKSAMKLMLKTQEAAALRRRETEKKQGDLFGPIDVIVPKHYEILRARYVTLARELVMSILSKKLSISYDVVWRAALTFPLVWDSDLKTWISEWRADGSVIVNGLGPKELVPKLNQNHTLILVPTDKRTATSSRDRKRKPLLKK